MNISLAQLFNTLSLCTITGTLVLVVATDRPVIWFLAAVTAYVLESAHSMFLARAAAEELESR